MSDLSRRYATKNIHIFSIIVLLVGQIFLPYTSPVPVRANSHNASVDQLNQYADDDGQWQNGNLNKNNSSYTEGESVPFRATLSGLSTEEGEDSHSIVIEYDNVASNKHAYDYLTSYDRDRNPDPCEGETCGGGENTGAIPADTTLSSITQASGNISIWDGQITDVSYESTPGHDTGDNKSTSIRVDFTADQSEVVLSWGGHIAKESDWGVGEGASSISGSPYHMRVTELDGGSPGNKDRSMKADAVILLPRIDITKSVVGGDAEPHDFSFDVSPAIDEPSHYQIPEGEDTVTIFDVPDGSYTISENSPPGYSFESGSGDNCTFEDAIATADVASGTSGNVQHASCEFTNAVQPGSITIEKETNPSGSSQDFEFATSIDGEDKFSLKDGQKETFSLDAGEYEFTEFDTDGWELTDLDCSGSTTISDATATIDLSAGEDVTCTYTNTELATIIVEKITEPDETAGDFTFEGDVAGTIELPGNNQLSEQVLPGPYTSVETSQDLWKLKDIVCDDNTSETPSTGDVDNATATFNVGPGDVVTCTFTNMEFGSIQVLKDVDADGNGEIDTNEENVTDWQWRLDNGDWRNTGDDPVHVLPNKTYDIEENMKDRYHVTDLTCEGESRGAVEAASIDIAPGEHVVCTFTNTRDTGTIVLEKVLNPADDDGQFDLLVGDEVIKENAGHNDSGSKQVVTGSYDVSEIAGDNTDMEDYSSSFTCDDELETSGDDTLANIEVSQHGQTVTCTFTNTDTELATITVEKITDPEGQEADFPVEITTNDGEVFGGTSATLEGHEDTVMFIVDGVGDGTYSINETGIPVGWEQTDNTCIEINISPGEDLQCSITNALSDLTLNIEKEVSTPTAEIGDFVTYTLRVENDSEGISYNTNVTDVPPEGFIFQEGSWTAHSTTRADHEVVADIGSEDGPTYASPGDWNLGTMTPGEVVTLTYKARVTSEVEPGDYPDLAYVRGQQQDESTVFGNIHRPTADDPFVGTLVSVDEDEEVSAEFTAESETTVRTLPKTGTSLVWLPAIIAFVGVFMFENRRSRRARHFMQQGVIS